MQVHSVNVHTVGPQMFTNLTTIKGTNDCMPQYKTQTICCSKSIWTGCVIVKKIKFYQELYKVKAGKKVKWSRYRTGVAQRVGRGIALLFHDRGTRKGVSGQQHAPAALYPRERLGTHRTGGWVDPRAGLDDRKISSPPVFDPGPLSL